MAEYIDREKLKRDLIDNRSFYPAIVKNAIETAPTEDVVLRSEVEELENELAKCYIELDKSTDFYCSFTKSKIQECPIQDEVEKAKQEVASKIIREIRDAIFAHGTKYAMKELAKIENEYIGEKENGKGN